MLPETVIRFLAGPRLGYLGTRGPDKVPRAHRVYGWTLDAPAGRIRVHVPQSMVGSLEAHLRDNGQVALTLSNGMTAETYQLKGEAVDHGASDAADQKVCRDYLEQLRPFLLRYGFPAAAIDSMAADAHTSVTFEVREIFDQTPGPAAGGRIYPEGE